MDKDGLPSYYAEDISFGTGGYAPAAAYTGKDINVGMDGGGGLQAADCCMLEISPGLFLAPAYPQIIWGDDKEDKDNCDNDGDDCVRRHGQSLL
jgi:hypothetical protein